MNASPLVTIAIPTYNRAETYLPESLRSALNQTYSNLEVIVSDNCSMDNTQAFVAGISDPRVRYFRHDFNIGSNNNFNFCFEQARGSYVVLLHDDDMIDEDFVESCIEAAQFALDVGVIRTGTRLIDSEGQVQSEIPNQASGLTTEAFFRGWFSGKTAIYLCSTLFNAQKLRKTGGFRSQHHCYQDTMAVMRLAASNGRVDVPEVKASFRIHPGEMGAARNINRWCEESLELLQLMCKLVPEESRHQILEAGARFFARANYGRATAAGSPWQRLLAMLTVMKYFKYRQFPSFNLLIRSVEGTAMYNTLRFIKRRVIAAKRVEQAA